MLWWGGVLLDTELTQVMWELFERLKALDRLQFRQQACLLCSASSKACIELLGEAILSSVSCLPCGGDCGQLSWAC